MKYIYFVSFNYVGLIGNSIKTLKHEIGSLDHIIEIENTIMKEGILKEKPIITNFILLRTEE